MFMMPVLNTRHRYHNSMHFFLVMMGVGWAGFLHSCFEGGEENKNPGLPCQFLHGVNGVNRSRHVVDRWWAEVWR
jgi:hypothetical protein